MKLKTLQTKLKAIGELIKDMAVEMERVSKKVTKPETEVVRQFSMPGKMKALQNKLKCL